MDLRKDYVFDLREAQPLKPGTTYRHVDRQTKRPIVLKLFSQFAHENDHFLIQEFQKLAALSGQPEIGTVFFLASATDGSRSQSCYVMEYIDGRTLSEYIDQNEELTFETITDIVFQLASAMEKAHNYGIYHGDLHGNNIMIDKMGYLKVIDFLWYDNSNDNVGHDLRSFNNILRQLHNKYRSFDGYMSEFLINHCAFRESFKGLRKELELIGGIAFDLQFLDFQSRNILSKLFSPVELDLTLKKVLMIKEIVIPPDCVPDMTEKWEGYVTSNRRGKGLRFTHDERANKIFEAVYPVFNNKFHALKKLNLLDWKIYVINEGEEFVGPYHLDCEITVTPKFFYWKRINELTKMFEETDESLEQMLLSN